MLFIQEYLKQRIRELTETDNLQLHFKHLVLQPNELKIIQAGTDIYLITDLVDDIRVESDTGLFDFGSGQTNEQIYEHRGAMYVENLSNMTNHIPFIQFTKKNQTHGITHSSREYQKNRTL